MKPKLTYKQRHGKSPEEEIEDQYKAYVGELDYEGKQILKEFAGDGFRLFKKIISELMCLTERFIQEGKYDGYINGSKLTEEQKKDIINIQEELKLEQKKIVQQAWAIFLTKHKFGSFKLFAYIGKRELPVKYAETEVARQKKVIPHINNTKKDDPKEDKAN